MQRIIFQNLSIFMLGTVIAYLFINTYNYQNIEFSADSFDYHKLAVFYLEGDDFAKKLLDNPENYPPEVYSKFKKILKNGELRKENVLISQRTPGFPLFLSAIYYIHGIKPEIVLHYHILLASLTGGLILLAGWILLGNTGLFLSILTVILYIDNYQTQYMIPQLLTETSCCFFLTLSFVFALWSKKKNKWWREILVALTIIPAIFIRQGLIFVGILYGIFLLFSKNKDFWKRVLSFGITCFVFLSIWSVYATIKSGKLVLLSSTSNSVILAGWNPKSIAKYKGNKKLEIEYKSLKNFWYSFPGIDFMNLNLKKQILEIPDRWRELIKIFYYKYRIASEGMNNFSWYCIFLGVALLSGIKNFHYLLNHEQRRKKINIKTNFKYLNNITFLIFLYILFLFAFLIALGVSFPFFEITIILSIVIIPFIKTSIEENNIYNLDFNNYWLISWPLGYLIMIFISIGVTRFIRPFIPVFYLLAVFSIPLLISLIVHLQGGSLGNFQNLLNNDSSSK